MRMMRSALLPVLCASPASAACTCDSGFPYCYSSGTGHDNRCYNTATHQYSKDRCPGTCTSSYTPAAPPPSTACVCGYDFPYCWATGSGHNNRCYNTTSKQYSKSECPGTCTGSYVPATPPPGPPSAQKYECDPSVGQCKRSSSPNAHSKYTCLMSCHAPTPPPAPPTPRPTLPPGEVAPPCDIRKSGDEVCDDYCNYRCSFYNTSAGETGKPQKITVIRITPKNVTGPADKNTADAPGDVSFVLSKKNLTQACLHNPRTLGCDTDVEWNDLYGTFVIEIDGQWGPYQMCNPADGWDTADWKCGLDCMQPTHKYGCQTSSRYQRNGTSSMGSVQCWCPRTYSSVGREPAPQKHRGGGCYGSHCNYPPASWPPQCTSGAYTHASRGYCVEGNTTARTLHGWDFASASTLACKACSNDEQCSGWAVRDGWAVDIFHGRVSSERCTRGEEYSATTVTSRSGHHYSGMSWSGIGDIGGVWYSHTHQGECPEGKPLGTNGCTWRLVETLSYKNATCVDEHADAAVVKHGQTCFDTCPKPLNRNTDCYLDCYRNVLLGDASLNITKPHPSVIVDPWRAALENSEGDGGCPTVQPGPLSG